MKILLFGASGTAGGAVLRACLDAPVVDEVGAIVRRTLGRPVGNTDVKLRKILHANYLDYAAVAEAFRAVDVCLFCLGTSVTRVSKEDYVKISHDYPIAAAKLLKTESPGAAFQYISGRGTRAQSSMFWSKVKGQAENELIELIGANAWRPAFIDAEPSPSLSKTYKVLSPLLGPVLRLLKPFPSLYVSGEDLGKAMLEATKEKLRRRVIENPEIRELAKRFEGKPAQKTGLLVS